MVNPAVSSAERLKVGTQVVHRWTPYGTGRVVAALHTVGGHAGRRKVEWEAGLVRWHYWQHLVEDKHD